MLINLKNKLRQKYIEKKHLFILNLFLIFVVFWTRFVFLGYSDYQGDEIKAMYRPQEGQSMVEFLLEQRKGPIQFFITSAIKPFTDDYYNNFVLRLPFAIAGALAIFYFYKFVKLHFGKQIATYSSLFLALNGFLIGFSRIVQYQSFTILFFMMSLYYFSKALYEKEYMFKGWYIGAFWWGVSALAHYDAIFIFPIVLFIFIIWYKKYSDYSAKKRITSISIAGLITVGIIGIFYIPFVLSLTDNQLDYWLGRLSDSTGKISSSRYLFELYNPLIMLEIYLGLFFVSLIRIKSTWPIVIWFLFPLIFMEFLTDVPGTHIYTYLIPVTVLMGIGLSSFSKLIREIFKKYGEKISIGVIALIFIFTFLLSHTIFIDHSPEYPWTSKKFLIWDISRPNAMYHLSIFGFPYYRHWEEIETYVRENNINNIYGTNERKSIPRFYLEGIDKDGATSSQYIYIDDPQAFSESILQDKPYYWIRIINKKPDVVFKNGDIVVSRIYNMPDGTIRDLEKESW